MRHEIKDKRPARRIEISAQPAPRFVGQPVDEPFGAQWLAVEINALTRLDARSQLAHHLAIDTDTTGGNQLIAMAP
jgi:hypothetical protein